MGGNDCPSCKAKDTFYGGSCSACSYSSGNRTQQPPVNRRSEEDNGEYSACGANTSGVTAVQGPTSFRQDILMGCSRLGDPWSWESLASRDDEQPCVIHVFTVPSTFLCTFPLYQVFNTDSLYNCKQFSLPKSQILSLCDNLQLPCPDCSWTFEIKFSIMNLNDDIWGDNDVI